MFAGTPKKGVAASTDKDDDEASYRDDDGIAALGIAGQAGGTRSMQFGIFRQGTASGLSLGARYKVFKQCQVCLTPWPGSFDFLVVYVRCLTRRSVFIL